MTKEQATDADCIRRSDIGLTDFEIVMCNGDYKEALKMLLDKIEKAPSVIPQQKVESSSVFPNKWISLDEKEPKDGQLILVTFVNMYDKRYVRIAEFREEVYRKYDGKIDQRYYGFHSVENIYFWGDKAVAWMPLSDPYKQEVEND